MRDPVQSLSDGASAHRPQARTASSMNGTTEIVDANDGIVISADLAALPAQINDAVQAAEGHAGQAVRAALKAGELLIQAKALVPHGQWENWLTDNCTVAVRTAQAYMRLATKVPTLSVESATAVALLPLREAVQAISASPTAPPRVARTVRLATRTDRERALAALRTGLAAIGKAKREVECGQIKRINIEQVRKKLLATITELDTLLAGAEVQP